MEGNHFENHSQVNPLTVARMKKEAAEAARAEFLDSLRGQQLTDELRKRIATINNATLEAEAHYYSLRAEFGEPEP